MFYLSPGVYVREKDISNIIPNVATTIAAVVGYSAKGSLDIKLITTGQEWIEEYGQPVPGEYMGYSALAYLEKGNKLYARRVVNGALYGGVLIMSDGHSNESMTVGVSTPSFQAISGKDILFYVFGKDPGIWNNDLGIRITNIQAADYEFDIEVYQKDSDGNYQQVESWTVSRKVKTDGFGNQEYLETRINGFSKYIVVADDTSQADTVMPAAQPTTLACAAGSNGSAINDSHVVTGWGYFANPDEIDINILINAGYTGVTVQQAMKTLAEGRKDCVAILDVPYAQLSSVTSTSTWRTVTQNFNSSYCALYAPWVKIYDPYNDKTIVVPPSGYVAAQIAYNDYVGETWTAPAGWNRGLLNVLAVDPLKYTQGNRDTLALVQVNCIRQQPGRGVAIWDQLTEQAKKSALQDLNVRRLLITLEEAIAASLDFFAF